MAVDSIPLSAMQAMTAPEADHAVQSLMPFSLEDVGSAKWKEQRETIEQLNRTSHILASEKKDDFVLSYLESHEKLPILLHELLVAELFRKRVMPGVAKDLLANPTGVYMYCYHEGMIVNLLECLMFHESCVVGFGDDLIELIDYAWRQVVTTLLTDSTINDIPENDPKKLMEMTDAQRWKQQMRELDIQRALSCVSMLWFVVEKLNALTLAVTNNVLLKNDLLCGFAQVLDARPWLRQEKSKTQKWVQGQWKEVSRSDAALICPPEAHCWFGLHFMLCDRSARAKYQYTSYKKENILRAKRHLNEVIVDQLPVLTQLQRAFEELTFLEPPTGTEEKFKNTLVIEQVPRILALVDKDGRNFNDIVLKFVERLRSKEAMMEDARRMAKLFDAMLEGLDPKA